MGRKERGREEIKRNKKILTQSSSESSTSRSDSDGCCSEPAWAIQLKFGRRRKKERKKVEERKKMRKRGRASGKKDLFVSLIISRARNVF